MGNTTPLSDLVHHIRFRFSPLNLNTVLLLEPNRSHGETLPAIVRYFTELGYNVDVLLRPEVYDEKPFSRIKVPPRIFRCSFAAFKKTMRMSRLSNYTHIFVNSSSLYDTGHETQPHQSFIQHLGFMPQGKYGTFILEHDTNDIERFSEQPLLEAGTLFTLLPLRYENVRTRMLNPHFFGEINHLPKNKITIFTIVGSIEAKRKNYQVLVEAVERLLDADISNFRIKVIGKNPQGATKYLPDKLWPFFEFTGRLNFPRLYEMLEGSDFLLPLLDSEQLEHKRYLKTGVSGSLQLSLGFLKPCIIETAFAKAYCLTANSALIYDPGQLESLMNRAIHLSGHEYATLQQHLEQTAKNIFADSLNNLDQSLRATNCQRQPAQVGNK